jgi:hypothetical protein
MTKLYSPEAAANYLSEQGHGKAGTLKTLIYSAIRDGELSADNVAPDGKRATWVIRERNLNEWIKLRGYDLKELIQENQRLRGELAYWRNQATKATVEQNGHIADADPLDALIVEGSP